MAKPTTGSGDFFDGHAKRVGVRGINLEDPGGPWGEVQVVLEFAG